MGARRHPSGRGPSSRPCKLTGARRDRPGRPCVSLTRWAVESDVPARWELRRGSQGRRFARFAAAGFERTGSGGASSSCAPALSSRRISSRTTPDWVARPPRVRARRSQRSVTRTSAAFVSASVRRWMNSPCITGLFGRPIGAGSTA